jgi:4-amino-4-deoxy-L-arabinose transferase-like glycosyltransferase
VKKITVIAICLFVGVMYLGLGKNYLFDWDEGIYASIGREMKHSGDLLIPSWNGDLWLEKPPVIGWVTGLGMSLAGENELGARLFMPLFAGAILYAIFRIGQKLGSTLMGAASAGLLGYFNLFLSRARTLNTDGMLLAAIAWTSWLLLAGSSPWLIGIVMGLAIMVKGASGVLAIIIALPLLIKKPKSYLLSTFYFLLLTIIPWHIYTYVSHGNAFITPYFLEQVVRRATVPIEFHMESRFFYFNFLYKDLGAGVVLVTIFSFALMLKKWVSDRKVNDLLTIMWWVAIPLVLFTLAKTRLSWYILPVYPAIALSIGYGLTYFAESTKSRYVAVILVVGVLIQMLWHGYSYVEPSRSATPLSDNLVVASTLRTYPGSDLAMLVSPNERVAQAILPVDQAISSSFRYGGAPSVVWYSGKHVLYYYNYDLFKMDATSNLEITTLIVTVDDIDKVPSDFTQVVSSGRYLGFVRGTNYALR